MPLGKEYVINIKRDTSFQIHIVIGITAIIFACITRTAVAKLNSEPEFLAWLEGLPKPWTLDEKQLNNVLPLFHEKFPNYHERLKAISFWRLGTPYKIFNLGEEQAPDFDPIFRLDVSDCTSHILTTISLTMSKTWDTAKQTLIQIHYKPNDEGQISPSFNTRWHYTSDRILHHELTPNVTHQYAEPSALKHFSLTLNKKQDGSEFLDLNWSKDVVINYIPTNAVTEQLLQKLPDIIGVAFVKESYFKLGIIMAHEGMIVDKKYLLHAGQVAEKTVVEDLLSYLLPDGSPRFDGIMLYEIKDLGD